MIDTNQLSMFDLPVPSMPIFEAARCKVRPVNHLTASNMVETYHYAHRVPAISVALGLYIDDVLGGVITYGMPSAPHLNVCGEKHRAAQMELNRLFVHEWAGRNAESYLIGQSFDYLRKAYPDIYILVSYADSGKDHVGYVYQATNWLYTGLSEPGGTASELWVNGERMSSKNAYDRYGTQGIKELESKGLTVEKGEQTFKHRYIYFLGNKRLRHDLLTSLRYPILAYPKGEGL